MALLALFLYIMTKLTCTNALSKQYLRQCEKGVIDDRNPFLCTNDHLKTPYVPGRFPLVPLRGSRSTQEFQAASTGSVYCNRNPTAFLRSTRFTDSCLSGEYELSEFSLEMSNYLEKEQGKEYWYKIEGLLNEMTKSRINVLLGPDRVAIIRKTGISNGVWQVRDSFLHGQKIEISIPFPNNNPEYIIVITATVVQGKFLKTSPYVIPKAIVRVAYPPYLPWSIRTLGECKLSIVLPKPMIDPVFH